MKNRFLAADIIKAISIVGVVFIHAAFLLGSFTDFTTVLSWQFRFCVPCFIVLWAYFFEKSYRKQKPEEIKIFIWKRFRHLLIVYVLWSVLYFVIIAKWETLTLAKIITTHFAGYGCLASIFF